jgi:glycosyltransferase involved in cell wall biosynthesis
MKEDGKRIFITWTPASTRASSLADSLGFEAFFFGDKARHKTIFHSFLTYFGKGKKNIELVRRFRPQVIAVTNTQWIIASLNLFLAKIYNSKVIFDSHSAAFDHPFIKYPKFLSYFFARRASVSIVTNRAHKDLLESKGARAVVITDIPYEDVLYRSDRKRLTDKFSLCFICTYGSDEPYQQVFEAFKDRDDVVLYVTGNYKTKNIEVEHYPNIHFTGYLSIEEYTATINNVDAIMVLTTRENTMQRGGSEAVSVSKPLITSNTVMLNEYFTAGTVFVDNTRDGIMEGVNQLRNHYETYRAEMEAFRAHRRTTYVEKISEFLEIIED